MNTKGYSLSTPIIFSSFKMVIYFNYRITGVAQEKGRLLNKICIGLSNLPTVTQLWLPDLAKT